MSGRSGRADAGFVTVAVVGLALVLVAAAGLVATLGAVAVARHRAAAAADLAALAAASHAPDGLPAACAAARRVAEAQGASLERCRLEGPDADVVVAVRPPGRLAALGSARARARAGPGRGRTGPAAQPQGAAGNHRAGGCVPPCATGHAGRTGAKHREAGEVA